VQELFLFSLKILSTEFSLKTWELYSEVQSSLLCAFKDWMLVLPGERQAHVLANLLCGELGSNTENYFY